MENFTECTEFELKEYIRKYPRELVKDICGTFEPPLVTYNDFTLGKWPNSIVARYFDGYPENSLPPFTGGPNGFMIDLNAVK